MKKGREEHVCVEGHVLSTSAFLETEGPFSARVGGLREATTLHWEQERSTALDTFQPVTPFKPHIEHQFHFQMHMWKPTALAKYTPTEL